MISVRRQMARSLGKPSRLRRLFRDLGLGLVVFAALTTLLGLSSECWTVSQAAAADHLAARAIEATSPPGPGSENAVLGAVLYGARPLKLHPPHATLAVLGLTFTVLFAFNLGLWRHLRRVSASPRRGVWRRER